MLNRPSKAAIVPVGLITALLAAIAVSLWLLLGGLVQAQATADTYQYAENGTDPVVTFTANDPEGVTPIVWSVLTDEPPADRTVQDIDGDGNNDVTWMPTTSPTKMTLHGQPRRGAELRWSPPTSRLRAGLLLTEAQFQHEHI